MEKKQGQLVRSVTLSAATILVVSRNRIGGLQKSCADVGGIALP